MPTLSINVTEGTRLLLVISASESGVVMGREISGYASAGLVIR